MEQVALGIIGCGVIGRHHMRTASQEPSVRVVALADLVEDKVTEVAEQYGVENTYLEGADLLDDPRVEAVILAFPTCRRTEMALRAFQKGKHAIIEKPIAMNSGEVEQMIRARGDLVGVCGSARVRFSAGARMATEMVARGDLGDLRMIRCRATQAAGARPQVIPPEWRLKTALNGGGILVNWGCYDLDFLLGITGWSLKPRQVLAKTWTVPPLYEANVAPGSDAETHVTAMILCEGGPVINYERSEYASCRTESTWQITGTRGTLHLHMVGKDEDLILIDAGSSETGVESTEVRAAGEGAKGGMAGQLEDFAQAIRGSHVPMSGLENALMVQKVTDAIYASAAQGAVAQIK
jgi:predicted dehydrogenase